jgi:Na+/H+-dicarboxylate symporter
MTPNGSNRLATRILWGLVIGLVLGMIAQAIGYYAPGFLEVSRSLSTQLLDPFGQIFLRLLFFVVIPLVFASLTLGVVQLGNLRALGPLAVRTGAFFVMNMAIGVALGLLMMNLLQPGNAIDDATKAKLMSEFGSKAQEALATRKSQESLSFAVLVEMFMPRNIARSVVDFQILPLILFAILLGAAGTQLTEERRRQVEEWLSILAELMTRIVHFALLLAPYAVPAMVFSVIVKAGLDVVKALAIFVPACLFIMTVHLFGTMSVWLKLFTGRSPLPFFRSIRTVLVTAFSTSSSNATLPTSLQVCRENLGLSPSTSGFVLPLGATMNMSGTALYEGCVVLFIAQIYGVDLSLAQQVTLLVLTVLSAVAVAGIPGGSLPLIAGLLFTFRIPPEGLAIIIGVDRILDMGRTTLNVGADVVTATIVDAQMNRSGRKAADGIKSG